MMIYGPGVGSMYSTIVDGRKMELLARRDMSQDEINDQISQFAVDVKFMKRNDFNEMYELYKDMVHGKTGTKRIKKK